MRNLTAVAISIFSFLVSFSQPAKVLPKNYPSLLWEISGNGLKKPSYLFGTMHVSSKMVFNLSDSFYLGIKNADVVALETDMGTWQDDFSRYDLEGNAYNFENSSRAPSGPTDYLTIGTLHFRPYEKLIEMALYSSPSMINSFLYRTNSDRAVDFEEDTYLDMHIYQSGKKWGKKVCGVENFDQSMELMKEAYIDAAKDKSKKQKSLDYEGDFAYSKLEDAYRTGNLDLLDTINKVNSTSAAFDEKFLYKRNEIQANSADSIIRTGQSLFVGVGAAHLPGQRGVIELLRRKGYTLRPIIISERDSKHKTELEKIRVPVRFSKQTSTDGLFSVNIPGKLYDFSSSNDIVDQQQFSDMSNGAYYMVTRININNVLWAHTEDVVLKKIDSVIYENVPGKILNKQPITKNGYKGFEVTNRTRRGDFQRYNIFVTPFEIILFKMSGNGDYVKDGTEANQFFSSIQFNDYKNQWKKWSPSFGGFEVDLPHEPVVTNRDNWQFMAIDKPTNTGFQIIRADIHNYGFVEEDTFDLALMEESFAASDFIDKQISRKQVKLNGYPALDVKYKYKDGSIAIVKFLIQGTHYYTLVAHSKTENPKMNQFLNSFLLTPFKYDAPKKLIDTSLYFTVQSPVPLDNTKKLSMYPDNLSRPGYNNNDDYETMLSEENTNKSKTVANDSTGEKIFVLFSKPSRYYYKEDTTSGLDSSYFERGRMKWQFRNQKRYELPNKTRVYEYVIGDPKSSRYVQGKLFSKNGVSYWLQTEGDTLSRQSAFISNFFESFMPADTVKGVNLQEKKSKLFFEDFFSKDTLLHRRAVVNIDKLDFDSTDFPQLKKSIQSLSWKEKKYMEVKNNFLRQLSNVKSKAAADYLKDVYYAAGDTVEFQYTVLNALLNQKTSYAYKVFKDIMINEPPVLDVSNKAIAYNGARRNNRAFTYSGFNLNTNGRLDYDNENFLSNLSDSLQLTATIFKDLLPLMNINDYESPIMELAGTLVDSNMINTKDYEMYVTKFLIEAKQLLKKQAIMEKNKSIQKAQKNDDDDELSIFSYSFKNDDGNSALSLYATLLMPYADQNSAIREFIGELLKSDDKRLKYNTTLLLLRNKKSVPDSILKYFAALDDYRYELYADLKASGSLSLFPSAYSSQVQLAESKLYDIGSNYYRPDSLVYLDKFPVQVKERKGFVYFFKYKSKKSETSWKIASVGIVPDDSKQFEFDSRNENLRERRLYNFTELTNTKLKNDTALSDQLKKVLKKMLYSKRNSAVQFYRDEERIREDYYSSFTSGE